uniref:Uncharacterized protein n=1 Tax=Anopheles coluzzii TaxID=1518534 RepID=A0A8W7PU13_ANOCL
MAWIGTTVLLLHPDVIDDARLEVRADDAEEGRQHGAGHERLHRTVDRRLARCHVVLMPVAPVQIAMVRPDVLLVDLVLERGLCSSEDSRLLLVPMRILFVDVSLFGILIVFVSMYWFLRMPSTSESGRLMSSEFSCRSYGWYAPGVVGISVPSILPAGTWWGPTVEEMPAGATWCTWPALLRGIGVVVVTQGYAAAVGAGSKRLAPPLAALFSRESSPVSGGCESTITFMSLAVIGSYLFRNVSPLSDAPRYSNATLPSAVMTGVILFCRCSPPVPLGPAPALPASNAPFLDASSSVAFGSTLYTMPTFPLGVEMILMESFLRSFRLLLIPDSVSASSPSSCITLSVPPLGVDPSGAPAASGCFACFLRLLLLLIIFGTVIVVVVVIVIIDESGLSTAFLQPLLMPTSSSSVASSSSSSLNRGFSFSSSSWCITRWKSSPTAVPAAAAVPPASVSAALGSTGTTASGAAAGASFCIISSSS